MNKEVVNYQNWLYTRITKKTAKNIYTSCKVVAIPVNVSVGNMWIDFFEIDKNVDFDKQVAEYIYYNCNNETGNYLKFYIEDDI